ncbi:hypothetical protein EGR_11085 [Echinococcus granulosus]|uniref:Uncharacterized protein n=1 Tax=Echinococcus granulosus TaxID=6210 RepID=W6U0T3_ECHGR|nr:hypothetical protein EGR_11085 [Echinococcus granulosus]EUB54056.1 hypothetical protein EGR_11085 [Echinococcus granulosus]
MQITQQRLGGVRIIGTDSKGETKAYPTHYCIDIEMTLTFRRFCKEGVTSTNILPTDKKRLRDPSKPLGVLPNMEQTRGLSRSKRAMDHHNPYTADQKYFASMLSSKLGASN